MFGVTSLAQSCAGVVTYDAAPVPSLPSASVGPGSSANNFTVAAGADANHDFALDSSIILLFELRGFPGSGTQTIAGYASSGRGWRLRWNSNGAVGFGFLPSTSVTFRDRGRSGVVCCAATRTAGGAVRGSYCGADAVQLSAAPAYVAGNASSSLEMLSVSASQAAGRDPLTLGRLLGWSKFSVGLSDADLKAYSNIVNLPAPECRYRFSDAHNAASNMLWSWEAWRDWDGVAATTTAGLGSAPPVFTVNGAPALNTIEAEIYREIARVEWHDNGGQQDSQASNPAGVVYSFGQPFRVLEFNTDAAQFSLLTCTDFDGVTDLASIGINEDGSNIHNAASGYQIGGVAFSNTDSELKQVDHFTTGGGDFIITDGYSGRVNPGNPYEHNAIQGIQLPESASFDLVAPSAPTDRLVLIGASSLMGRTVDTLGVTYASAPMLVRADYPGRVSVDGGGGDTSWFDYAKASVRAETVARVASLCDGSSSNRVFINLGNGDWNNFDTRWGDASDLPEFESDVGAWLDDLEAAVPGVIVHLMTGLYRTAATEATLIPAGTGVTMQDVRDALANVQSTRTSFVEIYDGTTALLQPPSADFSGDNVHPDSSGQAKWKAQIKTWLAAAPDSIGGGY
jgi:hypothetical protein